MPVYQLRLVFIDAHMHSVIPGNISCEQQIKQYLIKMLHSRAECVAQRNSNCLVHEKFLVPCQGWSQKVNKEKILYAIIVTIFLVPSPKISQKSAFLPSHYKSAHLITIFPLSSQYLKWHLTHSRKKKFAPEVDSREMLKITLKRIVLYEGGINSNYNYFTKLTY